MVTDIFYSTFYTALHLYTGFGGNESVQISYNSPFITCLSITGDWLQWFSCGVTSPDDSLWANGWSDRSQARCSQPLCGSKHQSTVQSEETLEEPPAIYRGKQRNTESYITICMPVFLTAIKRHSLFFSFFTNKNISSYKEILWTDRMKLFDRITKELTSVWLLTAKHCLQGGLSDKQHECSAYLSTQSWIMHSLSSVK